MTREEQNRKLAEWLDLMCRCEKDSSGWSVHGYGTAEGRCWRCQLIHEPPDFFADEAANAMLLDKMPAAELYKHTKDGRAPFAAWRCRPDWGLEYSAYHLDRKTAVCLAALRIAEAK